MTRSTMAAMLHRKFKATYVKSITNQTLFSKTILFVCTNDRDYIIKWSPCVIW